jgi:hypothetical protein
VFADKDKHSLLNLRQLFFKWHCCYGAPLIGNAVRHNLKLKENIESTIMGFDYYWIEV